MSPRTRRAAARAAGLGPSILAAAALAVPAQAFAQQADGAADAAPDAPAGEARADDAATTDSSGADSSETGSQGADSSPTDPSSGGARRVPEGVAQTPEGSGSSYPTVALADYVLGCMAANGNTFEALQQCSCSIDYIRERMDWRDYEMANTVMQVQLDRGQRGIFYRDSNWAKTRVERLQALQAESSLRCF